MSLTGYLLTWKTDPGQPLNTNPMLAEIIQAMALEEATAEAATHMLQGIQAVPPGSRQREIKTAVARVSRRWPMTTFTLRERSTNASETWTFHRNGRSYSAKGDPPAYSQEEMDARGTEAPEQPEEPQHTQEASQPASAAQSTGPTSAE